MALLARIVDVEIFVRPCRTRLPFRFGSVTLERGVHATARVLAADAAGEEAEGFSSDLLVPRWFDRTTDRTPHEDARALVRSALAAARTASEEGTACTTVFDLWRRLWRRRVEECRDETALVRGFGVALVERALLDAVCGLARRPFLDCWAGEIFGFDPALVLPRLRDSGRVVQPPSPRRSAVRLRHTIGLLDPLRSAEIAASDRRNDGLPEALEEDVREYEPRFFKVKIGAGLERDRARLVEIATLLGELGVEEPRYSLDGNEGFGDLGELLRLLAALEGSAEGRSVLRGLLHLEQPLSRADTFDPDRNAAMAELREFAPVIIDEADGEIDSFCRALELGYAGVSAKNCKGVFRAATHRALCEAMGGDLVLAGEDLTQTGVLPLQQGLVTASLLGIDHLELNGHHYFRGLDHLPEPESEAALESHPDLYRRLPGGGVGLRVEGGVLRFDSILERGFGDVGRPDTAAREAAGRWLES